MPSSKGFSEYIAPSTIHKQASDEY